MACFGVLCISNHDIKSENSDKPNPTNINSLPYEILAPIFRRISLPHRSELRRVCSLWKYVMDEMVGITIRIGNVSEFDPCRSHSNGTEFTYHSVDVIEQVGIVSCLVGNVEDPSGVYAGLLTLYKSIKHFFLHNEPNVLPMFKNPDLLSSIQFFGRLPPAYFSHLLSELINLCVLSIHLATLNTLKAANIQKLDLPNLERFEICGGTELYCSLLDPGVYDDWEMYNILQNILAINQNYFPALKEASIDLVYETCQGVEITRSVLQFLHAHAATIKCFNLHYCILAESEAQEEITYDHRDLLDIKQAVIQNVQLKNLRLLPMCISTLPYYNTWFSLISVQKSLEDLAMVGVMINPDFIKRIINSNYRTLVAICLCRIVLYENESFQDFDCSIFERCLNLKTLMVRGWTVSLRIKNMSNAEKLPKSLTTLDFGDMAIGTEDVAILALEMPKLRNLELRFVGHKHEMGMNENTLREVIRRRQLQMCRLKRSFNGTLDEGGIFNGDEDNPEYIIETNGGFIGFTKGKKGFYRSMYVQDRN